jgi:hypothetical protein
MSREVRHRWRSISTEVSDPFESVCAANVHVATNGGRAPRQNGETLNQISEQIEGREVSRDG